MAEGPDPGQTSAKSATTTPTLKELSNALDSVVEWFTLGVKLELEDHELRTIEQNYRGDRCKLEMLSRWLRSGKPPTWKAVVDALHLMTEHAVASKIQAKYCSPSTATTDTADTGTPPATSPQSPSAVAVAQRNIQMIKGKFSFLVTKSRRKLQYRKIDVDDVQTFLVTMYSSPGSEDGSDTVTTVVESAKSLDEIFRALSKHRLWDYLNYYLLQNIIEQFAGDDDELNRMMEEYQEDLTGYVLTVRIQTYLEATKHLIATSDSDNLADEVVPLQQDYELFRKLTAKCEVNITNHTLSYVINLWRSLAKQFALPRPAVILHEIAEGCIGITWLIPANLVEYITRMAQETANMFSEENVLRVKLEELCIYPTETKQETEPLMPQTELPLPKSKALVLETKSPQLETKTLILETELPLLVTELPLQETEPPLLATDTAALKRKSEGSLDSPVSDERENPDDIPEYELKTRGDRVMSINYSFLWQHLEPSQLLPKLVDKLLMTEAGKQEAESYRQKFAQNAVIIYQLFGSHCSPLKLCDTLDVTGQEHIARKLLQDFKHPTSRSVPLPSARTAVPSDLSETSELFQQLQHKVMDLLDQVPNALAKLKQVLPSLVLPLGKGKVAPLVDPLAYENTQTVRELFRLMSPYWNPLSTDLLGLLLEASGCNQAASEVAEFVEARTSQGHLVLCIHQLPTLASGKNDLNVADLETVHTAPLSELQSHHPAVFARLPEHKLTSTPTTVRISVEVDKPLVCIADFEEITTALSGLFTVPKAALVYAGCSKSPLVLCWLASHELVDYICKQGESSGERLLAESKVTGVAVGDQIHKCPTVKEVELWEACWDGQMEQIRHHLMAGVNVNVLTLFGGASPLHTASQNGYEGIVEVLLQAGAAVDLQTKDGWTALDQASYNGHHKVVELLLRAGANPDLQNKSGDTPLIIASYKGHPSVARVLLKAGATINTANQSGWTALRQASYKGYHKVVEVLLGARANPDLQDKEGYSPLHNTSGKGYDGIVEMLLQAGATVNLQTKNNETPLDLASYKGHHNVVELLLAAGASSDLQDKDGCSPLYDASWEGHDGIVEMLLQAGATVDLQTKDGWTALQQASYNGHHKVVELLLGAGANPDLQNKDGYFPLYNASQEGRDGIVEMLLQAGATVDLQTNEGGTALMVASYSGHPSVVRVLLKAGSNINTTTQWGETALYIAVREERDGIVELLLEANADQDMPVKGSQETPLMTATKKGNVGIIRKLIKHGASVNLTNKAGNTAYDLASVEGHTDVCQELLTHHSS